MAETVEITALDGHVLTAYRSDPAGEVIGGMIILHAVFGGAQHMADNCDRLAEQGIIGIAPNFFDRRERGTVYPYTPEGVAAGAATYSSISEEEILMDIEACAATLRPSGPVAVSGFCTGGTWAWVAAAELDLDAAVIFYGTHVAQYLDRTPKCPAIMHYGDSDVVVPMDVIEKIRAAFPDIPCYIYPGARHAFFNPDQEFYHPEAASLTWDRSIDFLKEQFSA